MEIFAIILMRFQSFPFVKQTDQIQILFESTQHMSTPRCGCIIMPESSTANIPPKELQPSTKPQALCLKGAQRTARKLTMEHADWPEEHALNRKKPFTFSKAFLSAILLVCYRATV